VDYHADADTYIKEFIDRKEKELMDVDEDEAAKRKK
jgi:hypothetical protein